MKKSAMRNKETILSTGLCLLPMALSILVYSRLPERIAIHFDHAGNPDNDLPRAAAAFGLPLILAALNLYSHFRVLKDPKIERSAASLRTLTKWIIPVLSIVMIPATLFSAMGKKIPLVMIATALAGVMVVLCGNYLPKCKRNYSIGIKLPWTLDSEETWNHTHRFAGFVWVAGGLVIAANAFLGIPWLTAVTVACLVALPFAGSYLFYQKAGQK